MIRIEIPVKLPSLNDYIRECRANRYAAAKFKRDVEDTIGLYIRRLPVLHEVTIHFQWIEENNRRDLDNVAFAKKFILDALVKFGKLEDDNRKHVTGFSDSFSRGRKAGVILFIEEVNHDTGAGN